jgi:gluconokinase
MLVVTLDVGTSSARVLCFDAHGRPLAGVEGRTEYEPLTTPDGGVEFDADRLVRAVTEAVDGGLAGLGARAADVGAVATSMFWHSLLALSGDGRPLTPVITWADTRSARAAGELRGLLDERAVHARTGAPLHSAFAPAKLRWLRRARPEAVRRAATWCGFGEYLALRMTGTLRASLSMASGTGLLDQARASWDPEVLAAAEIEPAALPPVGDAPLAELTREFAARWPALGRAAVFPPFGDGACSNLGSDCRGPDRIALNLGTSAALRLVTTAPGPPPPGLWRYRVDARRSLLGGATSEGGNVLAWCRRTLALPSDDELGRRLAALPPDSHGLSVLPFLAGERSPGWRGDARGAITGLGLATSALDILRAALESVAYRLGLVYERLAPLAAPGHEIVASGGALERWGVWARVIADVLGQPLVLSATAEASSRGAALLALDGLGLDWPEPGPRGRVVAPDPTRHEQYRRAAERQRRLYEAVVGLSPP